MILNAVLLITSILFLFNASIWNSTPTLALILVVFTSTLILVSTLLFFKRFQKSILSKITFWMNCLLSLFGIIYLSGNNVMSVELMTAASILSYLATGFNVILLFDNLNKTSKEN